MAFVLGFMRDCESSKLWGGIKQSIHASDICHLNEPGIINISSGLSPCLLVVDKLTKSNYGLVSSRILSGGLSQWESYNNIQECSI